ncbi:ergothioneine biosynthesis glutamate--cysteine ligase EgtA [Actinocrinis puniceicyclus]|uniref:Glutamate--cysteine ligase EgtA n=1 Tax=Actinocrinis puniceicyclus TaxID=977794 RepID=A0A8J7WMG1_9ACTN|nr:ergothioneine biosynthesis glutamate--cysteine ligase EgtA [Actinocrinis puniceicyclus]MBS2962387.1 ergothioneine biosynthesis glutamate--cysteine ligase EgtA [Actinocrinis puniceicyclus]
MDAVLHEEDAEAYVHGVCFKTGPPVRVGVELEWLVHDGCDPRSPVSADRLDLVLSALTAHEFVHGSAITREPGGQIELSAPPGVGLADCVARTAADLAILRRICADHGLALVGSGLDPLRSPPRVLDHPRYRAMEAHFDRAGPWGRVMMRSTASAQINLDAGLLVDGAAGYRRRWQLAHRLGPVLVAAFANSPIHRDSATGWRSTRQAVWDRTDPGRTRPPHHHSDPGVAWARYALDAPLLCIRRPECSDWTAPHGLTFRAWLRGVPGLPPPTRDDLDYHLTTLFPPVRPRGWLELRMIDAQPGDGWQVAAATTAALLDDPAAADAAYEATEPYCRGRALPDHAVWLRAARHGPADPQIGKAVRACLAAAETALGRSASTAALRRGLGGFIEQYAERGRCPADDQLDALRRGTSASPDRRKADRVRRTHLAQ